MREELQPKVKYVIRRIAQLCDELEDLIDYLDLLMARVANSGQPRYTTKQVKKTLLLK